MYCSYKYYLSLLSHLYTVYSPVSLIFNFEKTLRTINVRYKRLVLIAQVLVMYLAFLSFNNEEDEEPSSIGFVGRMYIALYPLCSAIFLINYIYDCFLKK